MAEFVGFRIDLRRPTVQPGTPRGKYRHASVSFAMLVRSHLPPRRGNLSRNSGKWVEVRSSAARQALSAEIALMVKT